MKDSDKIIAIDPGYDRLGWAVGRKIANQWQDLRFGCVQTDKSASLMQRYSQIIRELEEVMDAEQPTQAALESLFWFKNKTTALHVSEARGVALGVFLRHGLHIAEYTPLQIKQSLTGYGRADKKAVEKMVRSELLLPGKIIDDTIDALAIMICHQASFRLKMLT
jgi:crossover junction endodeoxyribonuclease RuvC